MNRERLMKKTQENSRASHKMKHNSGFSGRKSKSESRPSSPIQFMPRLIQSLEGATTPTPIPSSPSTLHLDHLFLTFHPYSYPLLLCCLVTLKLSYIHHKPHFPPQKLLPPPLHSPPLTLHPPCPLQPEQRHAFFFSPPFVRLKLPPTCHVYRLSEHILLLRA